MCCIVKPLDQCHGLLYLMWHYDTNEVMKRGWMTHPFFAAAAAVEDDMPLMCIGNMKIQGVCYDVVACWVNVVDVATVLSSCWCLKTIKAIYTSYLLSIHFYCYKVVISIVLAEVAWVKTMRMMFL